jgi:hypothetical protein
MLKLLFRWPLLDAAVLALCLATASTRAQNPPAPQPSATASASQVTPNPPIAATKENDELLAKTAKLYYSTGRAGMEGFDCAVHPDWRALFAKANKNIVIAEDDPRIVLLKSVEITLHAHMKGGSTLEWIQAPSPDKPLDDDSTAMLDSMHRATEQTLEGFLQFWTPFIDGSVVPASSEGLGIETSSKGYTFHAEDKGTKLTEVFNNSLTLEEFDVAMGTMAIQFSPSYKATDQGMLVTSFAAHIQAPAKMPGQAEQMRVQVEYQAVDGFPIPARINMEVADTGIFNFDFDGCRANRTSK